VADLGGAIRNFHDFWLIAGLIGKFWRPDFGLFVANGPSEFLACNPPKTAKLAIGFVAEQLGEVSLLTTETRVYCPDRYSLISSFLIG
jgi:hypothetical protein